MVRAARGEVRKVVLPAAGLGSRLLPITKELPKEMLPIFTKGPSGRLCPKPVLQAVFEQLHAEGFRNFCFVVGREKRAIEDHFTPDAGFLRRLKSKDNKERLLDVAGFYRRIANSSIMWINQPEPRGFGDAVLKTEPFIGGDMFLCHAGDTYIVSRSNRHLADLFSLSREEVCGAVFLARRVKNPRGYGVIEGDRIDDRVYDVKRVVEKPRSPKSNIAIMPLYIFRPVIFKALRRAEPGFGGELQLTDAIQQLIDWKSRVYAYLLRSEDSCLDIGTPETWWEALSLSHSRL